MKLSVKALGRRFHEAINQSRLLGGDPMKLSVKALGRRPHEAISQGSWEEIP